MSNTFEDGSRKPLHSVERGAERHWVGNGFPVRTLFSYPELGAVTSPFLLLDHAGPTEFPPTEQPLGVDVHPHRGFETVTIVYAGEVEHGDSSGGGGSIGPGDVQWMTAGSGVLHEEYHGRRFARQGGRFEMVQLWVNLRARDKRTSPHYQALEAARIPTIDLADGRAALRVIAGEYSGRTGPARTFTPMLVGDLRMNLDRPLDLAIPEGHTTVLVVLEGEVRIAGEAVRADEVAIFERSGDHVRVEAGRDAKTVLLAGEPIDEPIVGRGPFVMNTADEICEAMEDVRSGRMGRSS